MDDDILFAKYLHLVWWISCKKSVKPNTKTMGRGSGEVLPRKAVGLKRKAMLREYVVRMACILLQHISTHGFCVVDDFIGSKAGSLLLEEISAQTPATAIR